MKAMRFLIWSVPVPGRGRNDIEVHDGETPTPVIPKSELIAETVLYPYPLEMSESQRHFHEVATAISTHDGSFRQGMLEFAAKIAEAVRKPKPNKNRGRGAS